MRYDIHIEGSCPLVHKHYADLSLEASSEEDARKQALDLLDQKKIEWKEREVLGSHEEMQLDSIEVTLTK
jgi:hypothetical protein